MIRGLYSAASAMDAAEQNHDVTARNLAHATVPGYRQQGMAFTVASSDPAAGTKATAPYTDFRPGPLTYTGAPLDLAIDGDAFFVLKGPTGPLYTRNGTFRVTAQGQVVSPGGYPLQSTAGSLTVPPDAAAITVNRDGTMTADGQPVGQVQLTRFGDLTKLTSVGTTLFRADAGAGPQSATAAVLQGYREGSNVQPAEAMVSMIAGARYFEAAQRALRTIAESLQQNTRSQAA
jgi:flagellar basal-body rod protein FlgF